EFAELTETPPTGIKVELTNESDLYNWKVYMEGPVDTPYQGGTFIVNIVLPKEYPFKPPTVSFATKIYHPNVSNDEKGSMCLGMLKSDEWKPSSRIGAVLEFARQLLVEPMPDDAVEGRIAEQYQNDRKRFDEVARDWTRRYAREEGKK
ncbi:putative ubiquitin conjugating enzyme, partial [Talaromyces proteolyticus]